MTHANWTYYDFLEAIQLNRHDPEYAETLTEEMEILHPQKKMFHVEFFGQKLTDYAPKKYYAHVLAYDLEFVKNKISREFQNVHDMKEI